MGQLGRSDLMTITDKSFNSNCPFAQIVEAAVTIMGIEKIGQHLHQKNG